MAGYNYHFYLDDKQTKLTKELRKDTTVILFMRIGHFTIKYRTPVRVLPDQWESNKQEVRRNKVGYATDNDYLQTIKKLAQEVFKEKSAAGIVLTQPIVKEAMDQKLGLAKTPDRLDFVSFVEQFIESSKFLKKGHKTIKSYQTALNSLKEFAKFTGKALTYESVNLDFYDRYMGYLRQTKEMSLNASGTYVKNLKVFMRESYERQYHNNRSYQSKKFKVFKVDAFNIHLTKTEIKKIYATDLSYSPRLERVRDIFVVAALSGLRFSDISRLTKDNLKRGFIEIVPQKTQGISNQPLVIPIIGVMQEIFLKYEKSIGSLLPRVPTNQKMNSYLKEIGLLAKLTDLVNVPTADLEGNVTINKVPKYQLISTHTARRSYATNAIDDGHSPQDVMKVTGHRTETAFMLYIKRSNRDAAIRMQEGWKND